jgi:hypothetical protein
MSATDKTIVTGPRERVSAPPGAEWWAEKLGAEIVPRSNFSIAALAQQHAARFVVVLEADRAVLNLPAEGVVYFYHPGMARRRINAMRRGLGDPMVEAMGLRVGERVLDCTLGRGTDAIIASFVAGPEGAVVGVESVPAIAAFTEYGLKTFDSGDAEVNEAMHRIEVVAADSADCLRAAPSRGFGVVYFDPLFHRPVEESSAMAPLRALADPRPLAPEALVEARRVATRAVVVKQRRGSPLWEAMPPDRLVGSRKSRLEYGVYSPRPVE